MPEILLSKGKVALVDEEDFERVSKYKWTLQKGRNTKLYAARNDTSTGKRKYVYLHRFILGVTDPSIMIDHINNDGLDNRRKNLRKCNNGQNQANRVKAKHSTQLYKGIRRRRTLQNRFEARIRYKGNEIYLGRYNTAVDAAFAYDNAAIKYHGKFARTNFSKEEIDAYNANKGNAC